MNAVPLDDLMDLAWIQLSQRPSAVVGMQNQFGLDGGWVPGGVVAGGAAAAGILGFLNCASLMVTFTSILSAIIFCACSVPGALDSIRNGYSRLSISR